LTSPEPTTYGVAVLEKPKDYYRILGVDRNATPAAIRKAYRQLARKLHPEKATGAPTDALHEVQIAYETLVDAERRRRYDEALSAPDHLSSLSWSFVKGSSLGDLRRPLRPGSLSGEILLSAREAQAGGVLPMEVPIEAVCPECDRTGGFVFDCPGCGGEGKVQRRLPVPVRIPPGVRDGTTFQVRVDDAALASIFLTIHVHPS